MVSQENMRAQFAGRHRWFAILCAVVCLGSVALATYPQYHDAVWLEAECGDLWHPGVSRSDPTASGRSYMTILPSSGRTPYHPGPTVAKYEFYLNQNSYHDCFLWARVRYDSRQHNSIWFCLDSPNATSWTFNDYTLNTWHWERIKVGPLNKGHHKLDIKLSEEQVCIDKFLIVCDPHFAPYGLGKDAENKCDPDPLCPDLVITNVHFDPPKPKIGDHVQVKVTVKNLGKIDAGPFTIRWAIDQPFYQHNASNSTGNLHLAPGDHYTACFTFKCLYADCFPFSVHVDPDDKVRECNEDNNRFGPVDICVDPHPTCIKAYHWLEAECGKLHPPGQTDKDSRASDHYYLTTPKHSGRHLYKPGPKIATYPFNLNHDCHKDYFLWARVRYNGPSYNSFWFKIDQRPDVSWRFDDTQPYQWTWQRIKVGPLAQGPHTLCLKLREEQTQVDKWLITNDEHFEPKGLGALAENRCKPQDRCPDLVVKDISLFPLAPKVGEVIKAKIVIANKGNEFAKYFVIKWDLVRISGHHPAHASGQSGMIALAPGDVYTLCVNITCGQPGCYALTVHVDPDNRVKECNEDNNKGVSGQICVEPHPVCTDEYTWLEAECGSTYHPCQHKVDHYASQYRYVTTPAGSGHYRDYPGPKVAKYPFVTKDTCGKDYYVWARVCYRSHLNNSFWIGVDHHADIKWRFDDHRLLDWHWERIKIGPLSPGAHTLCFKQREEQTHLDKILITNDEAYVPQGLGDPAANCSY